MAKPSAHVHVLSLPSTRRQLVIGGAFAALAAACGSDDSESTSGTLIPAPTADTLASTTSAVPSTTAAPSTSPPSSTQAMPTGRASIDTPLGQFEIPLDPQRVIAIEPRLDVELAVALKLPLVAVGGNNAAMSGTPVAPWVPIAPDIPLLAGTDQNIEQIAALRPDLIVCNTGSGSLEQLGEIAPLLAQEWDKPWREILLQAAEWTRREPLIGASLDQYDATIADVAGRHAGVLQSAKLAVVQPAIDGTFRTEGIPSSFIHLQVLDALGGSVLPFAQDRTWTEAVSIEQIGELEAADGLLVVVPPGQEAAVENDPFWSALPAMASGRRVYADGRLNFGLIYSALECARLWDELLSAL